MEEGSRLLNNNQTSLPLLIVGNKIDKLSWTEKVALQTANEQQIFVVRYL